MDILFECDPDSASKLAAELAGAGCEFKVLAPRNMGGTEVITTILLPVALTAVQIIAQVWLELRETKRPVTIIIDGKDFVPTKENIEALLSR